MSKVNLKLAKIKLIIDYQNQNIAETIKNGILDGLPFIKEIKLVTSSINTNICFIKSRQQIDASCLLDYILSQTNGSWILLMVLDQDCFTPGLNFVFGVARKEQGAIVSTHRLENDLDFIVKECLHELGHVFGLGHCRLPCVMTFSNSVWEANQKNSTFCDACKRSLDRYYS